jgi:hypothetical protein
VLSGQELLEAASLGVFRLASLLGKVQFAVDGAIEGGSVRCLAVVGRLYVVFRVAIDGDSDPICGR